MSQESRLSELFKIRADIAKHDHWFEWSDDGRVWGAGQASLNNLCSRMVASDIQLEEVKDLIPEETLPHWQRNLDYQIRIKANK